ncbi:hypothetical protein FOCC_FOCC017151, partial [Frankliniella occidentalis]
MAQSFHGPFKFPREREGRQNRINRNVWKQTFAPVKLHMSE